jgi:hypothetical protein
MPARPVTEGHGAARHFKNWVNRRFQKIIRRYPKFLGCRWEDVYAVAARHYPNNADALKSADWIYSIASQAEEERLADLPAESSWERFTERFARYISVVLLCDRRREQISRSLALHRPDLPRVMTPALARSAAESIVRHRRSYVRRAGRHGPPDDVSRTCNEALSTRLEARRIARKNKSSPWENTLSRGVVLRREQIAKRGAAAVERWGR